jgi:hypothetical protein
MLNGTYEFRRNIAPNALPGLVADLEKDNSQLRAALDKLREEVMAVELLKSELAVLKKALGAEKEKYATLVMRMGEALIDCKEQEMDGVQYG